LQHSQSRNNSLAAPDVSLQEALHGECRGKIIADFGNYFLLPMRKLERQGFKQHFRQPVLCFENRRVAAAPAPVMKAHGQLLGQQFVELDPPPSGMGTLFE
jgi:hypothetical protein